MTSLFEYHSRGNILSKKSALNLAEIIIPAETTSFTDTFQCHKIRKDNPVFYSLGELLTKAVRNSEAAFEQYPVDVRRVKEIARSLFVEDLTLYRDPVVAIVSDEASIDELYIVGGRHRLYTIAAVFAQLAAVQGGNEDEFNDMLEQEVRCEVLHVDNIDTLLELLVSDNATRTIRASESAHLKAQLLGASSTSTTTPVKAAVQGDSLKVGERTALAAQSFARRKHPLLTAETRFNIGRVIAKWLMYGESGKKLNESLTINTLNDKIDRAWEVLTCIVEQETEITNFARSYKEIAERVIAVLINSDSGNKPPVSVEPTPEEVVVSKRRGRPKKEVVEPTTDSMF
jgi:hypothetical protein